MKTKPVARSHRPRVMWTCLILAGLTLAAYVPVFWNGFTNFDDDTYVTENPHVRSGPTPESLVWAFTTARAANWHPLTWISHMIDWRLYGAEPRGHHLTSLLLHLANVILLFLLLDRATGASRESAFVAALFAVHPLHVESVAWIAERKDVLSALFGLWSVWAYVSYTRAPSARRMALVAAALAAGLMAKPMLVTLPFCLLLLDVWPLERASLGVRRLIVEKIPLFGLSVASSVTTFLVQRHGGAMSPIDRYPMGLRIENAVVSYAAYLGKAVWPAALAPFYPHAAVPPSSGIIAAAALLLVAVTLAAWRLRKDHPYLLTGWLWYIGTLVPVIGLVQVGKQRMADRYMYLPSIGLFIIAAWGTAAFGRRWPRRAGPWLFAAAAMVVAALASLTWTQARVWHDSITLFTHDIRVVGPNATAEVDLGAALESDGKTDLALGRYEEAIGIDPGNRAANNRIAGILVQRGDLDGAIAHYETALGATRHDPDTLSNLGVALAKGGRLQEAIERFREALAAATEDSAAIHTNLGNALYLTGQVDDAIAAYREAIRLDPRDAETFENLGIALHRSGRDPEARAALVAARRLGRTLPPDLARIAGP
jgi:protein O-mannosyl-transferase